MPNRKLCEIANKKKRTYDQAIAAAIRLSKRTGKGYNIFSCDGHFHLTTQLWRRTRSR